MDIRYVKPGRTFTGLSERYAMQKGKKGNTS
jgi:hypothetical protein